MLVKGPSALAWRTHTRLRHAEDPSTTYPQGVRFMPPGDTQATTMAAGHQLVQSTSRVVGMAE
jgi:hypothetical protein